MNPIPTTNAMKPAPGKGVSSFPTPVIKDTVIVEVVNAWKGDYQPLEYGTKWDDVPHASVQGSYPDHKLISQAPNSEDGQWVKRIWANDRVDQDTYNYAIKYSGGSDAHPIYIRTYLLPRETYTPVPDLSPDPLFPGAFLVDEEVARTEGEFDSRYVQVTRVYETLPGPIIPTQRYNERGDIETVNTQTVPPGTLPDPDGLLVTQSQVAFEDVSKGTKTTATVEQHSTLGGGSIGSGLLGRTTLSDQIVSPSTPPDQLTFTGSGGVIESNVTPISATKSKKTTITSSGPVQLGSSLLANTPLGLVPASATKSIVASAALTSDPNNGLQVIEDKIEALDAVKSQRDLVRVSSWPTNVGVDYDEQLGIGIYYQETIRSPSEYKDAQNPEDLAFVDYKPIDQWKSLRRSYNMEKIRNSFNKQYYEIPTRVEIKLPDKLKRVIMYWGRDYGAGSGGELGGGASTGSYSKSEESNSRESQSINGDIYFEIEAGFNGPVKGKTHIFFLPIDAGRVEEEDILDKLNDFALKKNTLPPGQESPVIPEEPYKEWPYLKTKTENLVIISGSKAKTTSKSKTENVNINGFSSSEAISSSFDINVDVKSINIPVTLHPEIEIEEDFTGPDGPLVPTHGIRPNIIPATEPPKFPVGKYLYSSNVELYKYGFVKVTATTVEITEEQI